MDNFRKLSPHIADYVYAPKVYWNLSTTKLLTMEFVEGAEVNDLQSIQKLGINPHDIARLVSIFSLYYQLASCSSFPAGSYYPIHVPCCLLVNVYGKGFVLHNTGQ